MQETRAEDSNTFLRVCPRYVGNVSLVFPETERERERGRTQRGWRGKRAEDGPGLYGCSADNGSRKTDTEEKRSVGPGISLIEDRVEFMRVTGCKNKRPASLYISVLLPFPKICITRPGTHHPPADVCPLAFSTFPLHLQRRPLEVNLSPFAATAARDRRNSQ